MGLIISSMTVYETHLASFVSSDMGHGSAEASRLFAVMGTAGVIGRLLFGSVTLYYHVDMTFLLQSCGVATGLSMAGLSIFGKSSGYLTFFAIIFGGVGGSTYGFVTPILVDYFGLQGLPAALGGTYTVRAPAVLLFSPIAGWVRESVGGYEGVFFVCGALCVISALPIGVLHCECRRHSLHAAVTEAVQVDRDLKQAQQEEAVAVAVGKADKELGTGEGGIAQVTV
jgi:MFS family permease